MSTTIPSSDRRRVKRTVADSRHDASKLSFPLQLVIAILGVTGAIWASQYSLRSDVRDIRTRIELQESIDGAQIKLQEERAQQLRLDVQDMKRRQELQQFEIQSLKEMVLKLGSTVTAVR